MSKPALKTPQRLADYDDDFFAWSQEQAKLVRERRFGELDIENIAEELETLGRSQKRAIDSRLTVLLVHLLKWEFQPDKRSNSWLATIYEQRFRLAQELEDSPSLKSYPEQAIARDFSLARQKAAIETGIPLEDFPSASQYTSAQVLDQSFLPGPAQEH